MNNEEKEAIELLKQPPDFSLNYYNRENAIEIILNLIEKQAKEIEDKKEGAIAIAKANYILGQTEERSQWYKKINEKIEDLQHNNNGDNYSLINVINIIKELIEKEE